MFALLLAAALFAQTEAPASEVYVMCFVQNGCPPCETQKPAWAALAAKTRAAVVTGNVSTSPGMAAAWGITTTPTTLVVTVPAGEKPTKRNAKIVARFTGVTGERSIAGAVSLAERK